MQKAVITGGNAAQLVGIGLQLRGNALIFCLHFLGLGTVAVDLLLQRIGFTCQQLLCRTQLTHRTVQAILLHFGTNLITARRERFTFGSRQFCGQCIHLGLAAVGFVLCGLLLLFQLFNVLPEFLDLLTAAENAHAFGCAAAGKAAARIDHLTVHRNHAVAVSQLAGHFRGFVQIVHHNDAAQQKGNDPFVLFITPHQTAGHHGAAAQAAMKGLPPHGIQRQKCGAAAAGVF